MAGSSAPCVSFLCGTVVRNGLLVGAALFRDIAGPDPVSEGGAVILGLLVMIGQQFRLRCADKTIVKFLQRGCDTLVADLSAALEQARIGGIAGQGVLER